MCKITRMVALIVMAVGLCMSAAALESTEMSAVNPAPVATLAADNALAFDGTFETEVDPSVFTTNATASVEQDLTTAGNTAVKVTATGAWQTFQGALTLPEAADVTVSFDIWADADASPNGVSVTASLRSGDDTVVSDSKGNYIWALNNQVTAASTDAEKQHYEKTFAKSEIAMAELATLRLTFQANDTAGIGTFWIDNITVTYTVPEKPQPTDDPLGFNGSFDGEVPTDSFALYNNAVITVEEDPTSPGNMAAKLDGSSKWALLMIPITLAPDTDYKFSLDLWSDATAADSPIRVDFRTAATFAGSLHAFRGEEENLPAATDASGKTHVEGILSKEFIAEKNDGTGFYITVQSINSGAIGWFDNIKIEPVTQPTLNFEMLELNQIRSDSVKGIRFVSLIERALLYAETTEEYGFLVARESVLAGAELTMDTVEKKTGVAYNKAKGIDIYYDRTGEKINGVNETNQAVTVVLTSIPEDKQSERMTVRPYITISGTTYYANAYTNSYAEVLAALNH